LLLLEDTMMRREFPTDTRAKLAQTLCMLVVLAAIGGMFVHALTHNDATSLVAAPSFSSGHAKRLPMVP
jgi:hypothetical protein